MKIPMKRFHIFLTQFAALSLLPLTASAGPMMWAFGEAESPSDLNKRNFITCNFNSASAGGVNSMNSCSGGTILDDRYGAFKGVVSTGGAQIFAAAQVGSLKASAEADEASVPRYSYTTDQFGASAWVTSTYQDTMTFYPPGIVFGTPGFVQLTFDVNGPIGAVGSPLGGAYGGFVVTGLNWAINPGRAGDVASTAQFFSSLYGQFSIGTGMGNGDEFIAGTGTVQGRELTTVSMPVVFGAPHPVSVTLEAAVFPCGNCNSHTPDQLITFSGLADFSHTATLTGVIVMDANNKVLNSVNITGSDGFDYNAFLNGGAAVPEPEPIWLALGGCALLLAKRALRDHA